MKVLILFSLLFFPPSSFAVTDMDPCEADLVSAVDRGQDFPQKLYREFLWQSAGFLAQQLRWPNQEEAEILLSQSKQVLFDTFAEKRSRKKKEEENAVDTVAEAIGDLSVSEILNGHPDQMADLMRLFDNQYFYIRRKVASYYIRAVRQTDLEKRFRTVPTTPSVELMFFSAIKSKVNGGPKVLQDYVRGNFTIEHFKDLFTPDRADAKRTGPFSQPLVFPDGLEELEKAARFDAPFAFANFVDTRSLVTRDRAQKLVTAIEKAKAFIPISWSSGKPIPEDFLESLLVLAEERGAIIIVGATQQNYEGMPEIFLHHPLVHILTHTIENAALKLSNEPINPDIENPLTEAKKAGRYKPGQTVFLFHPHSMMETIPTLNNEVAPVRLISTGSVNEPFAPYPTPSNGRRKQANKTFQTTKAWIVEKADGLSQFDTDGIQDIWHPRQLSFADDKDYDGTSGFIDAGQSYQFRYDGEKRDFEKAKVEPEYIYLGDLHEPITDQKFVQSLINDLGLNPSSQVMFLSGDSFDFGDISHHVFEKMIDMNLKAQKGEVFVLKQVNGLIQVLNALLQRYPNARFGQIVGNHDQWLERLLNKTPDLQNVINGDFLDELNFAVKTLKINIWDYIFKQREKILSALLVSYPEKRSEIIRRVIPLHDPDRIDVLERGHTLVVGPPHRRNELGQHGDRTSFGKKGGSLKDHARAMPEGGGVTGHTHRLGIYKEQIDPGGLTPLNMDYGKGFHSATGQGLVYIYPNGTKQLLIYNPIAGTFRQRDAKSVLPTEKFFAEPLRIVENDNMLVDKDTEGLKYILDELARLKKLTQE